MQWFAQDRKYFEFIVTEEDVMMETDLNDFAGKMNVKNRKTIKYFTITSITWEPKRKKRLCFKERRIKTKWLLLTRKLKRIKKNKFLINPIFWS